MANNATYNITDIWKSKNNIGYTTYVNVTDGTERTVYWGQLEWLGAALSLVTTTGFVGAIGYFAGKAMKLF